MIYKFENFKKLNESDIPNPEKIDKYISDPILNKNYKEALENANDVKADERATVSRYFIIGDLDFYDKDENQPLPDKLYRYTSLDFFKNNNSIEFKWPDVWDDLSDGRAPFISLSRSDKLHRTFVSGLSPVNKTCKIELNTNALLNNDKYILINFVYPGTRHDRHVYVKEEEVRVYLKYKYWKNKKSKNNIIEYAIPLNNITVSKITLFKKKILKYYHEQTLNNVITMMEQSQLNFEVI